MNSTVMSKKKAACGKSYIKLGKFKSWNSKVEIQIEVLVIIVIAVGQAQRDAFAKLN